MIIDGRAIAARILEEVRSSLPEGIRPVVRAVSVDPNPATRSYLRIKAKAAQEAGMVLEVVELPGEAMTHEVITAIQVPGADAVIVQLPLPDSIDQDRVLASIPEGQDADVLSPTARARFNDGEAVALIPPVACAVGEVLQYAGTTIADKSVVVIGNGYLVGAPVGMYLKNLGANVSILDKDSFEVSKDSLKDAHIVVAGSGVPNLITPDLLTQGVVLIDAGTSEQEGLMVGDIDPSCSDMASVFTPVPGGIGPIAVACLFQNVLKLRR